MRPLYEVRPGGRFRRYTAWTYVPSESVGYVPECAEMPTNWISHGRTFTCRGAIRRAKLRLAERVTGT